MFLDIKELELHPLDFAEEFQPDVIDLGAEARQRGPLKAVGPNATLVAGDFENVIRRLKAELAGEIQVAGPVLAQSLSEASLIDEYRLYLRPVVLGGGQPFFAGPRPPLHLVASDLIGDDVIRLTYVPA